MPATSFKPEDLTERRLTLEGVAVRLTTFKLGDSYISSLDNIDPGAVLVRAEGRQREEAEQRAIDEGRKEILVNPRK